MKITEKKNEKLKREYDIVVEAKKITEQYDAKLSELGSKVKVDGFRPGKVPAAVVKARYGKSALAEVLDEVLNASINDLYAEKKISPAMRPEVDIKVFDEGKDLEFSLKLEIMPEVPAADFAKIKLKKPFAKVTDAEVEKEVKRLAEGQRKTVKVAEKRALKKGDVALIDFEGFIDDKAFAGGKGKDYPLELGSNSFIPGFEDQLIGKNAGDDVDVKVAFPKEYAAKDLAGKDAVFKVKIKEIQKYEKAEVDDELAKKFGKKTLKELKELIKTEMEREFESATQSHLKRGLLDALADMYKFEVPESMVKREFDAIWASAEKEAKAKKEKLTDKDKAEYEDIANRRVRLGLLLTEIGKKEKVQPNAADINRALIAEARNFPGQEKALFEYYQKNAGFRESINAGVFEGKVVEHIISKVTLEPEEVSSEKLWTWYDDIDAKKEKSSKK